MEAFTGAALIFSGFGAGLYIHRIYTQYKKEKEIKAYKEALSRIIRAMKDMEEELGRMRRERESSATEKKAYEADPNQQTGQENEGVKTSLERQEREAQLSQELEKLRQEFTVTRSRLRKAEAVST